MSKITDLTNYTTPATTDVLPIVDVANDTTKKVTIANIVGAVDITPGNWLNAYCFRAYNSTTTSLTDNTNIKILFQTEEYDYSSAFASSTFTAPIAGVYHFEAGVTHATASATPLQASTKIYKNGAVAILGQTTLGNATIAGTWTANGDLLLAANDTIEVYHMQDSAGVETTATGSSNTWFSGHLIHAV